MNKVVFLADFFAEDIQGGAEIYDDILISSLRSRGCKVATFRCSEFGVKHLQLYIKSDFFFIVSNFISLSEQVKKRLEAYPNRYVILEHDHKYLKNRNPADFKDFTAPKHFLTNQTFYSSAKTVFCQSSKHKEILQKNLGVSNAISLGCSLWSKKQLEVIKNCRTDKNNKAFVLNDPNPVKGLAKALSVCKGKNIEYDLVDKKPYEEFITELAKYERFVFFPKTLESFCRVILEARMLGCKLVTNNLNGCTYEEWFSKYKGEELIEYVDSQRERVVDDICNALFSIPETKEGDITVILNCYRRPYNLQMQVDSLRAQTIKPSQIWLWINYHEDNKDFDPTTLGVDRIIKNDFNWKFYGRFAGALLADTEYVAIYDDDTIPGSHWHENCLECMKHKEGIMGTAGYIQTGDRAMQYYRHGWPSKNENIERVDYVGHAWFFKREWLSHLWREKPPTWDNGEDMHFSYTAQKYGGIQTYCPPHPKEKTEMHGSLLGNELGVDSKATSNNQAVSHQQFFSERDMCVRTAIDGGWDTVEKIK